MWREKEVVWTGRQTLITVATSEESMLPPATMFLGALGRCTANASSDSRLLAQNYGRKCLQSVIGFFNLLSLVFSSQLISISNNSPPYQKEPGCCCLRWELIQGHFLFSIVLPFRSIHCQIFPSEAGTFKTQTHFQSVLIFSLSHRNQNTHKHRYDMIEYAQKCSLKLSNMFSMTLS